MGNLRTWWLVPLLVGCGGKNADDSGLNVPSEHYPEGGWTIDACHNDLVSTGWAEGDIAENLSFDDQFDETIYLHDFCDHVVYIVFVAEWDVESKRMAETLEGEYQQRVSAGGMFIEAMVQNTDELNPNTADLRDWADTYGLTMPVVGDDHYALNDFADGASYGLPYKVLLDRGARVDMVGNATLSEMDVLLSK